MKLSDYVASFAEKKGIREAFVLTGGCIVHIIDSIAKKKNIRYIPVQHEQSGAMAADCYARLKDSYGLVLATSGPGATNLLTGICCSYYDSIPVVAITGQVPTSQLKKDSKSRQIGFQETDVVSIFKSVTKYAKLIDDPNNIRYELEKAFYLAREGRPGPVLLDICDDVQRAEIDPSKLKSFTPPKAKNKKFTKLAKLKQLINASSRPIFIFGAGIRLSNSSELVSVVKDKFKIPYTLTWGAMDIFDHKDPLYAGSFGVTSGRAGNFAVQNSDLIISIGTRLDTHEVGSKITTFAREAKKIVVDIDNAEQIKYKKMGMKVDLLINDDLVEFLKILKTAKFSLKLPEILNWSKKIKSWKKLYPSYSKKDEAQKNNVNPYYFMNVLSKNSKKGQSIIADCGSNLIWTMQGFKIKKDQRVISAWNHSPMGYALPASMGAAFAGNNKVICITGDGGMQINIQELATIHKHNLNIAIFIVNNHCHGIIQGTQQNWLKAAYHASDPIKGKLPDPDFSKIANAYGIKSIDIKNHKNIDSVIKKILNSKGPILCNIHMDRKSQIYPKLLFGKPIEDSDPLLEREEFYRQMIVKPIS